MSERFDTFRPPPPEPDPWETTTPTDPGQDDELDPREAAALLAQTRRQAERQFELQRPIVTLVAAVTVLVAYGAVWLSVRHQHPYSGPTAAGLGVLYGVLALWIVFLVAVTHRARRGVSGRSSQQRRIEGVVFGSIWICVYVFQGALHHTNPTHTIAYGVYPAVAPLIVVGAAAAGYEAARGNLSRAGFAAAAVALGAFAAFAGPAGVWGVVGVGLSVLLLIATARQIWLRRA
jgi:hypothetical protein